MDLYTFGLLYDEGKPSETLEEIDVTARNYQEARREAERVAREGYVAGWKLVDLPPGGSSGLVTVIKL